MKRMQSMAGMVLGLMLAAGGINAQELGQWSFADGAKGWTAIDKASVSDVARRPGGKSLLITQFKDAEADSAWLSPVLKNPGKPVCVSLWTANNYVNQKDPSYAAAFEIVPCDTDGKLTANGGDWTYLPWEDKRQIQGFRHSMTREGLQWKYYSAVKTTAGEFFRVRLCWPKAMIQGECYFTDVSVSVATDGGARASATAAVPATGSATAGRHVLEIGTPANANLFFSDDPLRFEFLLYANDGKPVGELQKPVLKYDITDYEKFQVTAGELSFAEAKPLAIKGLKGNRAQNLRLSAVLPDAAAKEVGREFFLHAKLMDGDKTLAEDTITYAVVNPRPIAPKDYDKCRFITFYSGGGISDGESKHANQAVIDKLGGALVHQWDYEGWKRAQPVKGGPITIARGPDFPKLVYCPNMEQFRGRKPNHPWGDMSSAAPAWALLDDPFYPGCKGFDIDGYVQYIVAYVRANRHRIVQVVPSGLERIIDARTLELHRKAYAAIKKEFPDLPVGMMNWGVPDSAEQVDLILKEKLYEVADFFDTHVYQSGVGWKEWERLQKEFKKLGITRRLISTEFAFVGGNDQLQGSRDQLAAQLDAHAHDMYRLTYFNTDFEEVDRPVLRGEFPGDGFPYMQFVKRPRVSDAIQGGNWGRGMYGVDQRENSLMPLLKTVVYYNFMQNVECADFKLSFKPTDRTVAYVYAREGKTIVYVFLREPNPSVTLALNSNVPYTLQDLYGRTDRVTPAGASLVVATLDPLALIFDGEVPALYDAKTAGAALKAIEGGLALPTIARGATGKAVLSLPPIFSKALNIKAVATVDGTWPKVEAKTIEVTQGKGGQAEFSIPIVAVQAAGTYNFTTRLYDGDKLVSVLKQPLVVGEMLTAQLTGVPMTKAQDPAIIVTIRSLGDLPLSGTVKVANRFFGTGFGPDAMEQPYTVAPRGTAEIRFPVPREQANLATSYEMKTIITDKSGFSMTCEDDVSFQACVKTKTPITVDADLSDWKLDELIPIPYEKIYNPPHEGQVLNGRFYTRWDDQKLYFAAEITDNTPVTRGVDEVEWLDDNICFTLYPWPWHMGESLNTGYYREHLGALKGGKAGFLRGCYVPSGPSKPDGAEIVVKRTATGYLYEWSYPKAALYPLVLEKGGAFRLSMSVFDQRKAVKENAGDWGDLGFLTFAGFNTSVNALPNLWRQFRMVEE